MGKKQSQGSDIKGHKGLVVGQEDAVNLIPFVATILFYFYLFLDEEIATLFSTVVKCLPILALILFVHLHRSGRNNENDEFAKTIFLGLIFSVIGDACLVWPDLFAYGTVSFGIAQMLFMRASGVPKLCNKIGIGLLLYSITVMSLIRPGLFASPLLVIVCVSCYAPLLFARNWFALSRFCSEGHDIALFWTTIAPLSFLISDSYLSLNKFWMKLPLTQEVVMVTYYFAQFAVAMSVLQGVKRGKRNK